MSDRLKVSIEDHVATVTIDRADKRNAIDIAMFEAFIDVGRQLRDDNSLRCVVLHGAGDHFCAGIDLSVFAGGIEAATAGGRLQPREDSIGNFFQSAAQVWQDIPVPVIAAIQGVAFGGGLQIALGADIRYASKDAEFSVMEINWGIIPDMAITATARAIVPLDKLKELAYSGRVIDSAQSLEYGLITAIHEDPLAAAQQLAGEIAGRSPDAIRAVKAMFATAWLADNAASLGIEAELQGALLGRPNQIEAVMARMQSREAKFSDAES